MKILEKSTMPNGTKMQLEDWREDYPFIKTINVAAYPKAENTLKDGHVIFGETFRLDLQGFATDSEAEDVFKALKEGSAELKDFSQYFYLSTDKEALGLESVSVMEADREEDELEL